MCFRKYIFVFLFVSLATLTSSVRVKVKARIGSPKEHQKPPGIFHRFLRDFLTLLTTAIPEKKLKSLSKTFYKEIDKLEYKYSKKLAKKIRKISLLHRDEIKDEYQDFLNKLNAQDEPRKLEFLVAMDDVFRAQQDQQLRDYLEDMIEYGREQKLDLNKETKRLIHDVIHNNILKRGKYNLLDLDKKLKKAIKE